MNRRRLRFTFWIRIFGRGISISRDQYWGQAGSFRVFGVTFLWLPKC